MIVVCGGIKGGSGKTTATTNLAIIRAAQGSDVLLIDADDQETSYDFTAMRNEKIGHAGYSCIKLTGKAVKTETERLASKYQDIVIDTGGRGTTSQRAALLVAGGSNRRSICCSCLSIPGSGMSGRWTASRSWSNPPTITTQSSAPSAS